MKKQLGLVYFATTRKHFCVPVGKGRYKDLTTGKEFRAATDTIRPVVPEDLYSSSILIETDEDKKWFYIRVSFLPVKTSHEINSLVTVDLDDSGKLIGIRLAYPWLL